MNVFLIVATLADQLLRNFTFVLSNWHHKNNGTTASAKETVPQNQKWAIFLFHGQLLYFLWLNIVSHRSYCLQEHSPVSLVMPMSISTKEELTPERNYPVWITVRARPLSLMSNDFYIRCFYCKMTYACTLWWLYERPKVLPEENMVVMVDNPTVCLFLHHNSMPHPKLKSWERE